MGIRSRKNPKNFGLLSKVVSLKVRERRSTPEMVPSDQVFDLRVSDACVASGLRKRH
jgi:hypothetical protein